MTENLVEAELTEEEKAERFEKLLSAIFGDFDSLTVVDNGSDGMDDDEFARY